MDHYQRTLNHKNYIPMYKEIKPILDKACHVAKPKTIIRNAL